MGESAGRVSHYLPMSVWKSSKQILHEQQETLARQEKAQRRAAHEQARRRAHERRQREEKARRAHEARRARETELLEQQKQWYQWLEEERVRLGDEDWFPEEEDLPSWHPDKTCHLDHGYDEPAELSDWAYRSN